ncbi:MAG: aldo/keto reductase [Verrucomicrobiota bacterium]
MKQHAFPGSNIAVSELCFGCWGVASDFHWGDRVEDESIQAMIAAVDAGVNFFDTAPVYGDGASETLLGKVMSDNNLRDQLVIASKVRPDAMKPEQVVESCDASLQRLRTDHIDIYQTHWTDRSVPLADTWGAMQQLQEQGKVRQIAVCNAGVEDLDAILTFQKPFSNQLPYNLLWRMIETDIIPKCVENEIGILVYSPLMHGMLADKYQSSADVPDGRARSRHFTNERPLARHGEEGCEEETFAALEKIRVICKEAGRTMTDLALAWTVQQQGVASVIAGARNAQQLQENVEMLGNPVSADLIESLNAATADLQAALGPNPDMWDGGENSRYR